MKHRTRVATGIACLGMVTASMVGPQVAGAQVRGAVDDVSARSGRGFGGGTIHFPTNASGPLPVVAIAPGFMSGESSIKWIGPELAEEGMVVITIGTNTPADQPDSRAKQLQAALDHVIANPPPGVQLDPTRLGVGGWSMGGGGAMRLALDNPEIDVVLPLTPWHTKKRWSELKTPTLMVAAQADAIAPKASHAEPFYETLGGPKAYLEFRGASHMLPTLPNAVLGDYLDAFATYYLTGNTSGANAVCQTNREFSAYENTCPLIGGSAPTDPGPTDPAPVDPAPVDPGNGGGESWWSRLIWWN